MESILKAILSEYELSHFCEIDGVTYVLYDELFGDIFCSAFTFAVSQFMLIFISILLIFILLSIAELLGRYFYKKRKELKFASASKE